MQITNTEQEGDAFMTLQSRHMWYNFVSSVLWIFCETQDEESTLPTQSLGSQEKRHVCFLFLFFPSSSRDLRMVIQVKCLGKYIKHDIWEY